MTTGFFAAVIQPFRFHPWIQVVIPFFSCWTRPDHRYLIGVWLVIPMLITEGLMGTLELVHRLGRLRAGMPARLLAAGVMALAVIVYMLRGDLTTPLPDVYGVVIGLGGASLLAAACLPARRVAIVAGPLIAVGMLWVSATQARAGLERRASFQRPQAMREHLAVW